MARTYPNVGDVLTYAKRTHQERFLGTDQKAIHALQHLNKHAQAYQRKLLSALRQQAPNGPELDAEAREMLVAPRQAAVDAFTRYAESIRTGRELESLLKYDSPDVLKSVVDRLNNLKRTGIFKDSPPPFEADNPVWRYKLNALSHEEKKMFVLFTLQNLFAGAMERGECNDVVEVVVLDELGTYTSADDGDDGDGIIGKFCRESRKFGGAFWGAIQSPASVPESLLSASATKMILGLDESCWRQAVGKLRIERTLLEQIRAHATMAVQMKEKGLLENRWLRISLTDGDERKLHN